MLYLDPNKEKLLTFEVDVSGDSCDNIISHVRLFVEGIEIGFPCEYKDNKIIALIKPLRSLVKIPLKTGMIIEARLDVLSENQDYYSPWQGQIEIKSSFTIEAKLVGEERPKDKKLEKFVVKNLLEDEIDSIIDKSIKKQDEKPTKIEKEKIQPKPVPKPVNESIKESINKPLPKKKEKIVEKKLAKPIVPSKKEKPVLESKKTNITKDSIKNITKEGVFEYMTRAGSKNPKIQEIIYEQAMQAAGSSKPYDVLKQVIKFLKKKEMDPTAIQKQMYEMISRKTESKE